MASCDLPPIKRAVRSITSRSISTTTGRVVDMPVFDFVGPGRKAFLHQHEMFRLLERDAPF